MSEKYKKSFSDDLYNSFASGSDKLILGAKEVQIRGVLDDRFEVWSLDGITD